MRKLKAIHGGADIDDSIREHYGRIYPNGHLDESDLVIFRLMGAKFLYSSVEFQDINPCVVLAESDVS